jgi:hypothetical protein
MVRFVVSSAVRRIIQDYNTKKKLSDSDDGYIDPGSISIEHLRLVHIASTMQASTEPASRTEYSLSKILETTSLYIEPNPKPKPVIHDLVKVLTSRRIRSIRPGWRIFAGAWSSKSTTPWSETLGQHQSHHSFLMRTILLKMRKWSRTSYLRSSISFYRWYPSSWRYLFG